MPPAPKRILLAEHSEDAAQTMVLLLGLSGYAVTSVGTVAEGLRRARDGRFDLCLLDGLLLT